MIQAVIGEAIRHGLAARLGLDCGAKLRIGEDVPIALAAFGDHGRPPREQRFQRIRMAQRELHAERKAAHLSPQLATALARLADLRELVEHELRIVGIDEHRGDHHRPAVAGGDLLQPRHRGVHALGEHEHAVAGLAERRR